MWRDGLLVLRLFIYLLLHCGCSDVCLLLLVTICQFNAAHPHVRINDVLPHNHVLTGDEPEGRQWRCLVFVCVSFSMSFWGSNHPQDTHSMWRIQSERVVSETSVLLLAVGKMLICSTATAFCFSPSLILLLFQKQELCYASNRSSVRRPDSSICFFLSTAAV